MNFTSTAWIATWSVQSGQPKMVPLLSLLALATALPPAFLDGPNLVTVWTPEPLTAAQAKSAFTLTVGHRHLRAIEAKPVGKPAKATSVQRDPHRVVLVGNLQTQIGGSEWDPDSEETEMRATAPGIYEFVARLPKGEYEFKVARGGSWDENYGAGFTRSGSNIGLTVPADETLVRFVVDFNHNTIRDSINQPNDVAAPTQAPRTGPQPTRGYRSFQLTLDGSVETSEVTYAIRLEQDNQPVRPVYPRDFLTQPFFYYEKNDLGAKWSARGTQFKLWSPTANQAEVLLYQTPTGGSPKVVGMKRGRAGTWATTVPGDLQGTYYRYRLSIAGKEITVQDIYGYAASQDLKRTMVVDLGKNTQPKATTIHQDPVDAVIYELHVRDFTIQPESGIPGLLRGTYSGLSSRGTTSPKGHMTGLDYLVDLGVTDIHLLPVEAFDMDGYSWGYATTLFNYPAPRYSIAPKDPVEVIHEFRDTVGLIHQAGLRVIMDVVYNHTWPGSGPDSPFDQIVPYYYLRTDEQGRVLNESGVGNALADERPMARKFVEDSLVHWAKDYGIDGFRFDLLGMHHPESVRSWVKAIRAVRPDAVIYGEPWTGGGPLHFGKGAQRGMGIAVFNDQFRTIFRGDTDGTAPGFMHGGPLDRPALERAMRGSPHLTAAPSETINYLSAHDNMTLWDKTEATIPEHRENAVRLGLASVLFSQGVPFFEGGVELGRHKQGIRDSYNSGDAINQFDWKHGDDERLLARYFKGLIAIRRNHPVFRLRTQEQVAKTVTFLPESETGKGVIAMRLDGQSCGDTWSKVIVLLNGNATTKRIDLPEGIWHVAVDAATALDGSQRTILGDMQMQPLSAAVLWR